MKNILLFILIIIVLCVGCDKIKKPDQRPPAVYHCIDSATQIVNTNILSDPNKRKVLIEDYTGHRCPNCPPAAVAAESLIATYDTRVVVIANHVSKNFGAPVNDTTYKEDFRNATSTEWDSKTFNVSGNGLPKGMINRQGPTPQSSPLQSPGAWPGLVQQDLAKPQTAKIELTSYYNPLNHYLTVKAKTTFKTSWPNNVNLMLLLTQDGMISDQEDNSPPPGVTLDPNDHIRRLNYHFDHVIIGSINDPEGGSGQLVKAGPVAAKDTLTLLNSCYLVEKCFYKSATDPQKYPSVCLDDNNINIVAFVYDVLTHEVLQVEQMRIRND